MALNIIIVKRQFALELERVLEIAYRCRPSNEQVARDLVVFSKYSIKLNRESVRKWRNGTSFPDLDYIIRLIDWVGLDVSRVFRSELQNDVATAAPNGPVIPVPARKISAEQIDLLMQMLKELPKDHGQDRVH